MFASFISYLFLKNKELGNISQNVFITNKSQAIKKFGEDFTIHIGEETQKPDCDLLIYNNEKKDNNNFIENFFKGKSRANIQMEAIA